MALDERLRRELDRAAQPADPSGLYEHLIRRRERRRIAKRVQSGLLAVVVLVGSVGGFYALTRIFRETEEPPPVASSTVSNGMIVFERQAKDAEQGSHLWIANPDGSGEGQLTFGHVMDRWPAWSPDGTQIVFTRLDYAKDSFGLWVIDAGGTSIRMLTPPGIGTARGDWSPDGTQIAFAGVMGETPQSGIYVMNADGSELAQITDPRFAAPDNPEWSSDGSKIAFSGNLDESKFSWDVYLINPDGSDLRNVSTTGDDTHSEMVIGWLPNGNLLVRDGPGQLSSGPDLPIQTERWVEIATDGELVRVIYEGPANTQEARQGPSLSPDGRFVVFDTPDARSNTVRFMDVETGAVTAVTNGNTPAWQPLPEGEEISPVPTPTETPSADDTQDIGLGFPVCNVYHIPGVFEPGISGTAFVGTKAGDTGCPGLGDGFQLVAVDVSGDGLADASYGPLECDDWCSAFAAPDVDGDGTDELLIQNIQFSIAGLRLYEVRADPAEVIPITVATPGYPEGGLDPGAEPQLWLGGDGFQLDTLRCFAAGGTPGRVLIQTSASQVPGDSPDSVWQATATWFDLNTDGTVSVVDAGTFEEPVDADPLSFAQGNGICGARLPVPYGNN